MPVTQFAKKYGKKTHQSYWLRWFHAAAAAEPAGQAAAAGRGSSTSHFLPHLRTGFTCRGGSIAHLYHFWVVRPSLSLSLRCCRCVTGAVDDVCRAATCWSASRWQKNVRNSPTPVRSPKQTILDPEREKHGKESAQREACTHTDGNRDRPTLHSTALGCGNSPRGLPPAAPTSKATCPSILELYRFERVSIP